MSHILVLHQRSWKTNKKKEEPVTERKIRTHSRIQTEKSRTVIQRKEMMRYENTGKRMTVNRKFKNVINNKDLLPKVCVGEHHPHIHNYAAGCQESRNWNISIPEESSLARGWSNGISTRDTKWPGWSIIEVYARYCRELTRESLSIPEGCVVCSREVSVEEMGSLESHNSRVFYRTYSAHVLMNEWANLDYI